MPDQSELDSLAAAAESSANSLNDFLEETGAGRPFDWSEESIIHIDPICHNADLFGDFDQVTLVFGLGCYFGELLIKYRGAKWREPTGEEKQPMIVMPSGREWNVIKAVEDRPDQEEPLDRLTQLYNQIALDEPI